MKKRLTKKISTTHFGISPSCLLLHTTSCHLSVPLPPPGGSPARPPAAWDSQMVLCWPARRWLRLAWWGAAAATLGALPWMVVEMHRAQWSIHYQV